MNTPPPIPLFKVYMPPGVLQRLQTVFDSGHLAQGEQTWQFERDLATYVGNPLVNAMSDRSGALTLALYLAGVRGQDEVIMSPLACLATAMPVANLFARPVWADVDPATGMIDARGIERLVTERTRAVLAVHWGGDVCDLDALREVAHRHDLKVIDDAAEAFGAEYKGKRLGNNDTDFTTYSFYAVSHITTGEGGAIFCADAQQHERARWLKRYGIHQPSFRLADGDLNPASDIAVAGFNFAMTNLSAAIGAIQLENAGAIVGRCRDNGRYYETALNDVAGLKQLRRRSDAVSGYWVYSLLAERRDDLKRKLHEHGIGCQRLHLRCDLYSCFGGRAAELPGVAEFDAQNLSVPSGVWVGAEERERVVECIRSGW